MTQQNFVTLPREVVEQLTDALANRCGTNSDEWSLINTVRAALTEQVQPAQGELPPLSSPVELNPASNSVMGYHEAHLKEYARAALLQSNAERVPLENMTDMQRMEVFNNYCTSCGCKDPRCQCWNDE